MNHLWQYRYIAIWEAIHKDLYTEYTIPGCTADYINYRVHLYVRIKIPSQKDCKSFEENTHEIFKIYFMRCMPTHEINLQIL